MSYLVLARKSRPQTFAEVVGQKAVVRTLQNALKLNRVPHALIFSGVRGTGKTTLARVMAKALNCEQGPAAEPCNRCRSCREITDGTSIDLQEVDGASNRGIQEIRELKEKIRFMPTSSRYKIIIIDEVHMLTTEAFNALLKTLEEPPPHVYFMFATTELHKVPITILSRCQRYELKRLSHRELADHFSRLAEAEGVQITTEGLDMIVREAGGSVRDGLSLLDQIFSYCGREVKTEDVIDVLGLVSHRLVAAMGSALLKGELATVYALLDEIYLHGTDIKRFSNDLLQWFRGVIVCSVSTDPGSLLEVTDDELEEMKHTAAAYSVETLAALFNLLLNGLETVSSSQQPRLALELTFIRTIQFRDITPVSELISRFDNILAALPCEQPNPVPLAAPQQPNRSGPETSLQDRAQAVTRHPEGNQDRPAPNQSADTVPLQESLSSRPTASPAGRTDGTVPPSSKLQQELATSPTMEPDQTVLPEPDQLSQPKSNDASPPPQDVPAPATNAGRLDNATLRRQWDSFLRYVHERQPWIAAPLRVASSVECQQDVLIIHFDDSTDCTMLKQANNVQSLTEFVLNFFQENLTIRFEVPGSDACAVHPANGLAVQEKRRALAKDPLVLTALDVFTGQVGAIRVGSQHQTTTTQVADGNPSDEEQAGPQ
ncbi:DNA polymerase III subunit gamma/tau [Desulfobulbus alkaliphilus]|uniref:DNA polymerase III subunit gamma/tau n=1 Tax=Desulfobulbus alkaliphilus TaxID=869814 RepID=UPI001965E7EC|nr:DNA polymerase III subunit gamma/tau [Desulfobulbus alkaliphilus]